MKTDFTEIQEFLKNKEICLLGNSQSILKNKKDIDKFDMVCRMNRGCPKGREEYIGSRTDILFLSTKVKGNNTEEINIKSKFNPKYIVWMTLSDSLAEKWVKTNAYQNPKEDNRKLKKLLTSKPCKPSTGILSIYFLLKYIEFKKLTIYGIDFFKTGTWYHNLTKQPWHMGKKEKKVILSLIKDRDNVKLVME